MTTPEASLGPLNIMEVCADSRIPQGWIKINDRWSPTSCGNPTSIEYNVWILGRYDNQPVGTTMQVCADAPTPAGWVDVGSAWNPTGCGHPEKIVNNIKNIKKVRNIMNTFTGTNRDLAAALEAAIAQLPPSETPDKPVKWKLENISGERGGLAGSLISVTISTEAPAP